MKTPTTQPTNKPMTHSLNIKLMKNQYYIGLLCIALLSLANNTLSAQGGHSHSGGDGDHPDVELHVNSELGNCDFDIASNLTQQEWKRATKEIGNIIYLNPLASAKPLGVKNWDFTIETTTSDLDEESGAWNNTFHHPDSVHYLSEGPRLAVPGFRFRMGITERLDAGIYYAPSQPFGANYGFLGLEAKYSFINDTIRNWASSVRLSYVTDANIKDFNISVTAIDLMASKTFLNVLTPYAGLSMNWNHSKEVTDEVNLHNENYLGVRGIAGVELRYKFVNLGYEMAFGDGFNNRTLKLGVTF